MSKITVDELQVLITANTEKLRKGMNDVKNQLGEGEKKATGFGNNFAKSILKGNVATKILNKSIQLVTSSLSSAISRLDTLNNFPRVMSNLGVSSEDSEAAIQRLSDGLVGLPTTLDSATNSVQRFTSANGNVKASTEMFLALNNAILAGGATMDIQQSALEQLSQAYAKGKPDMMEWRTAMTAMPAQLKQVAIAMGYADASQLGEALRTGKVSMNEFMVKISELNKNGVNGFQSFEEQARNSTGGVATSMTNVKTAITRGLSDIMNAIGQSNIAGFFQGIAKAINAVIPYIVGFVKAMVGGVATVSSLFGKSVKKDAESINSALSGSATNTNNLSSNLNKSASAAKKVKGALAGFDEMNVLQETPASSSGDSSGAGGAAAGAGALGAIDLSAFDTQTGEVVSKADQIAQKIREAFSGIDFTNLITSFTNLQTSMAPVLTSIKDGLGWVFQNVLLPLGEWLIEGILPAAFNILAGAFDIVNQAIIEVQPLFNWLWIEILQPMGAWAADALTVGLNAVGDALKWIADNQVAMSILEGIAGAILLIKGAVLAYNAVMTICNVVTGTFTGIMAVLTSPITLVVAAIAAVIAIVVLLVKNWDTVKEVAIAVWEKIKEWWGKAGEWFKTKIVDPIKNFFVGMWNGLIDGAKGAWNGIKSVFSAVTNWFKNTFKKAWEGVKNVFSVGGKIFDGIKEGIANTFKTVVNGLIGGINKIIAVPFNTINGLLNKIRDISVAGVEPFKNMIKKNPLSVPQIPKLAKGGVVDGPTIAMIGEAGKEAIVPLENNTAWIDKLADKINNNGGQPTQVIVKIGEETIKKKFIDYANSKSFETNEGVFSL